MVSENQRMVFKWNRNFKISGDGSVIEHLQLFRIRYRTIFHLGDTMILFPLPQAGVLGGILAYEWDQDLLVSASIKGYFIGVLHESKLTPWKLSQKNAQV